MIYELNFERLQQNRGKFVLILTAETFTDDVLKDNFL